MGTFYLDRVDDLIPGRRFLLFYVNQGLKIRKLARDRGKERP